MEPVSQSISARTVDVDVRFLSPMYPSFLLPLYFQGVKSATIKLVPESEATKVTVTHDECPEAFEDAFETGNTFKPHCYEVCGWSGRADELRILCIPAGNFASSVLDVAY